MHDEIFFQKILNNQTCFKYLNCFEIDNFCKYLQLLEENSLFIIINYEQTRINFFKSINKIKVLKRAFTQSIRRSWIFLLYNDVKNLFLNLINTSINDEIKKKLLLFHL